MPDPRDRVAWAADVPLADAAALYGRLSPYVGYVKVGLSLFVEHGPDAVKALRALGARVFLDLKLHDIPHTVEAAAAHAAALGVSLLTVHASGGSAMLEAAVRGAQRGAAGAGQKAPRVLAVTVLTSLEAPALAALGVAGPVETTVLNWGRLAKQAGVDGMVCSPRELPVVRRALGPAFFLCTPGIRPLSSASDDQARTDTAAAAISRGADLLVVGRPIHGAADPVAAAKALLESLP